MFSFRHIATYTGPRSIYVTNVSDLEAVNLSGSYVLYSATHLGGGMAAWRLASADRPVEIMSMLPYSSTATYLGRPEVALLSLSDSLGLFSPGLRRGMLDGHTLANSGMAGAALGLDLAADVIHAGSFGTAGGSFLYTVRDNQTAIDVWQVGSGDRVSWVARSQLPVATPIQGDEVDDVEVVNIGDRTYMVSVSGLANYVAAQQVNSDGSFGVARIIETAAGFGVNGPVDVEIVNVAGVTYLVVASGLSSSLTVLRLAYDGSLSHADHVIDELTTRFQGATALETVSIGGRSFVIAGGGDDGISIFTVRPDGRLVHLASLADRNGWSMADVSSISAIQVGGLIAVFVSSRTEAGLTQFAFDPGTIGRTMITPAGKFVGTSGSDLLQAGADTTWIDGGGGDDILVSGNVEIKLTGGDGADVFVATALDGRIWIMDYEHGVDRLDLSGLGMIRSTQQLTFRTLTIGIRISFGDTDIDVRTRDGTSLQAGDFTNSLFPIAHYDRPGEPTTMVGTSDADSLAASRFGSDMFGYGGKDILIGSYGNDSIRGGDDDDTLDGGIGNDRIWGENGNDILRGGTGADELQGGEHDDSLYGGDDNDTLLGHAGNDTSHGEAGDDIILDGHGNNSLYGGSGNDSIVGGGGWDILDGGGGDDTLIGGAGNDRLTGGSGHDWMRGHDGNDRLHGEGGNDYIYGGNGNDVLLGDGGNDQIWGDSGNDAIWGGDGDDRIVGGAGNDSIRGGAGNDLLVGASGVNVILGEDGNDRLYGGHGGDRMDGGAGNDQIFGGNGKDQLFGGSGNDTLLGRAGDDIIRTGTGNNIARGEAGNDIIVGDSGTDRFYGDAGNDRIYGNGGADVIDGGAGSDTIFGGVPSLVLGGAAHTLLIGGAGNDHVIGGRDNDWILGGAGQDRLTGGAGADLFIFRSGADFDGSTDLIRDFRPSEDRIDLRGLNLTFIDDAPFSGPRQMRLWEHAAAGVIVDIDINGDHRFDLRLSFGHVTRLGADDFLL